MFYRILEFTQSYSGTLVDFDEFFHLIPGTYKDEKPTKITAIDKIHLKCDCNNGSIGNSIPKPILYRFALDKPPGP